MYSAPVIALRTRLQRWSQAIALTILVVAVLVFLGWLLDIQLFRSPFPGRAAMNPLSSVCFFLLSFSFLLFSRSFQTGAISKAGTVLVSLVLLLASIKAIDLIFNAGIGIDELLFADKVNAGSAPNRMAPNTTFCFIICSFSLLFYYYYERRRKIHLTQYLSLLVALIGWLSILSYLYRENTFYGILIYIPMAAHTACCFFLFSLALLFMQPMKGPMKEITGQFSGSLMARILIPATILIPSLFGFLRIEGYRAGIYSNEFGVAILVLCIIIIFVAIIWYNASLLNKRDRQNLQSRDALRDSEDQMTAIFENGPDVIVVINSEGRIVKWNPQAEKLFGWKSSEVAGLPLADTIIPTELRDAHRNGLRRYLATGEGEIIGKTIELFAMKKDGSMVDIALSVSPMIISNEKYFVGFIRDITERKMLEKKLKLFNESLTHQVDQKTKELTDIFERITDGFIALDKDFNYIYVNKRVGELTRREPSSLIGKNVWKEFPEAIGSATYNAFMEAMASQQYVLNTDYFAPLDLWQENHIYPSPNGISVFIRDVSDRKKSERAITEAKDLADKLIDSLPGIFYFFDANRKFIRWNRQMEIVTGYSASEIAAMNSTDFFEEPDKSYIEKRIADVYVHGYNDAEASFRTKDGTKIPYYFKAALVQYNGQPCVLGTGIDIAERKKAEIELLQSVQKYKLLFQNNPLPMWMLSIPHYHFMDVNDAAMEQYGYTREEFLKLTVFDIRPDDEVERFKTYSNLNFRGVHHAGIWKHRKKDGGIMYVDVTTHDFIDQGSAVRLVLANNVTEKYIADERLKESYESIRELSEHLQKIREEERSHIAREIHDELGQLLTVLKMDVSWLNKKVDTSNAPAIKEKFTDLLQMLDTTVKTVRRIASELRPTLLDDLGLVAAMEWHLEEFEKRSGIQKQFESAVADSQIVDSVKIGLFRILQESLTNVARHSQADVVKVSFEQKNGHLLLQIADNGKGFDINKTTSKTLGLLGMRERTKMMGGEYHIISKPGQGTTVEVSVPLSVTK